MPRARAILQSEYPYSITARCINREWFNIPMDDVWEIFCEELSRANSEYDLMIHSFILMSNHYHLIASTPQANISECMQQFMHKTSRKLTHSGNRINQTYAGRHYKCILDNPNYYLNAYKYNYRNPVTAGICKDVLDYKYSTLHSTVGLSLPKIPTAEDTTYLADPEGTLNWLNKEPDAAKYEAVRYALKRSYFLPKKCGVSNRPLLSVNDVL